RVGSDGQGGRTGRGKTFRDGQVWTDSHGHASGLRPTRCRLLARKPPAGGGAGPGRRARRQRGQRRHRQRRQQAESGEAVKRMGGVAALLGIIPHHAGWLRLFVAVNVVGSLYGFNWYARQLADTPWYLWPVTPDSPLSSLGFGVYLALRLSGRRTPWFAALV